MDIALKAGDMHDPIIEPAVKMWLSHHLVMALNFLHLSGESLFPFTKSIDDLLSGMVIFMLRGIGLKDAVIRHYVESDCAEGIMEEIFSKDLNLCR